MIKKYRIVDALVKIGRLWGQGLMEWSSMGVGKMSEETESNLVRMRDQSPEASQKGVSRDDVVLAFKLILGRLPENDTVIRNHQVGSLDELRVILLKSTEFANKYQAMQKPIAKA